MCFLGAMNLTPIFKTITTGLVDIKAFTLCTNTGQDFLPVTKTPRAGTKKK